MWFVQMNVTLISRNNGHFGINNGHFGSKKIIFVHNGHFGTITVIFVKNNGHFGQRSFWITVILVAFPFKTSSFPFQFDPRVAERGRSPWDEGGPRT